MSHLIRCLIKFAYQLFRKPTLFLVVGIIALAYWLRMFNAALPSSISEIGSLYGLIWLVFLIFFLGGSLLIIVAIVLVDRILINTLKVSALKINIVEGVLIIAYYLVQSYPGEGKKNYRIEVEDGRMNYFMVFEDKNGLLPTDFEDAFPFKRVYKSNQYSVKIDSTSRFFYDVVFDPPNHWGGRGFTTARNLYIEQEKYNVYIYWNTDSLDRYIIVRDSLIWKEAERLQINLD